MSSVSIQETSLQVRCSLRPFMSFDRLNSNRGCPTNQVVWDLPANETIRNDCIFPFCYQPLHYSRNILKIGHILEEIYLL